MPQLPGEIWLTILSHVRSDPQKGINHDDRAFLSRDSLNYENLPQELSDPIEDLGRFRLTCRRHAELGARELFRTYSTRFTTTSLRNLQEVAKRPGLAQHVNKFVYKMPFFYIEGPEGIDSIVNRLAYNPVKVERWQKRSREQEDIIEEKQDVYALTAAFRAFTNLQQILILQTLLDEDHDALKCIRLKREIIPHLDVAWAPACSHATRTMITATNDSKSNFSHLSSYFFSTDSATEISRAPIRQLPSHATQLTRLILTFYEEDNLADRMQLLGPPFRSMLMALSKLENLHVGFFFPLDLPFSTLFPDVHWESLVVFGVQGWRLEAKEIIEFTRRHRNKLKGLRLRNIVLREGSAWRDVLTHLRTNMRRLNWLSLGRISYAVEFDRQQLTWGFERPGWDYDSENEGNDLGSDSEDESENGDENDGVGSDIGVNSDDEDTVHRQRRESSDHGHNEHDGEFPPISSPRSATFSAGIADVDMDSIESLHDEINGEISNSKRKMWELWVLRKTTPY
ncbi:hypothetical protein C1H76_9155 [Elsinoe australis]|uniref:Uncharacterized protein n=1 Tax=Elsinoe australis TaxID=40998 RepID=A0A4U7ATS9_9PEZI|nr:hypothetical protein C1H76_9155 [Elsinoe australis]